MSLRDLVGRQGLVSGECALHPGRIGGATRLAAGGVSTMENNGNPTSREVEERRLYDVWATREEENKVSRLLASNAVAGGMQLGQGTEDSFHSRKYFSVVRNFPRSTNISLFIAYFEVLRTRSIYFQLYISGKGVRVE